jgi:hypothetical protein
MLDSDESFLDEYKNVCSTIQITPVEQDALALYYNWKQARVPCH